MENKDSSFTLCDLMLVHRALSFTSGVLLLTESCEEFAAASRMFDIAKKVDSLLVDLSENSCEKVIDFTLR